MCLFVSNKRQTAKPIGPKTHVTIYTEGGSNLKNVDIYHFFKRTNLDKEIREKRIIKNMDNMHEILEKVYISKE